MSPEAEVLGHIDILAGLIAAAGGPDRAPSVTGAASQLAALARTLELNGTVEAALRVGRATAAGESVESLATLLDQLQQTADLELTRRLSRPAAPAPEAVPAPEFTSESREHLESIEQQLLALEADPANSDAVHAVFRGFHTIKGLAAIFEAAAVRDLAHQVETLLDEVRQGRLAVSPALIDLALESADRIGALIEDPAGAGLDSRALGARLAGFSKSAAAGAQSARPQGRAGVSAVRPATVRVETAKLDQLVDLVGELLIAQSMVAADPTFGVTVEPRLSRNLAQMARMTAQLQKAAMAMRLVPLGPAFRRLERAFRDLLRASGKQARLEFEGEDIELDRTILEQLADPLLHMVRNAVDHGLETPQSRAAAGKSTEGRLKLAAWHQSGHIVIEVSDDGKGLDAAAISRRAVERGLAAPGASLAAEDIFELIFEPGFSTAERVTDVSGRGVGMDVVRRQIEKLRGHVEIRSKAGEGTSFLLRLPLTLATIDGLIVRAAGVRYILPLFSVREIVRPDPGAVYSIEGRSEVAMIRDRVLPVKRLAALLGLANAGRNPGSLFVVTETSGQRCCLAVDELEGKQQVVIKSLGEWLGHRRGISGAAILGDGSVGLILDIEGLLGGTACGAAA